MVGSCQVEVAAERNVPDGSRAEPPTAQVSAGRKGRECPEE